jgi:predicted ATPase
MLTRLRVNGFKNLIGVDLYFGPFTCIAGANAVGKSNLFDAILFFRSLMEMPIMDAAMAVRDDRGSMADVRHLFTQTADGSCLPITLEAEMLVPAEGADYLDQPAEAKTTFLVYRLELRYRPAAGTATRPRVELVEETLDYVKQSEARAHLPFDHSASWRTSVVKGRRTSPYISTELREGGSTESTEIHPAEIDPPEIDPKATPEDEAGEKLDRNTAGEAQTSSRVIKLHQDTSVGGGRTRLFQAEKLPRTVLSTVNAQESPTAVLARQEILNWRLLQLEPSALRAPDGFDAPARLAATGAHLPATLYRLSQQHDERPLTEIANRLFELIDHVSQVHIDRDEKRELLTLLLKDKYGTELPAKALSDGTLRFLALASIDIDPTLTGLICMEEPENGIHPERIGAMLGLLQDIAVDPTLPTGDDNPLRQVVINTHSPVVVGQVPEDTVIFAEPQQQKIQGSLIKGVSFRCLTQTWRADKAKMPIIAKGKAIAFLQPIAERGDPNRRGTERRVIDRQDLQLKLDL